VASDAQEPGSAVTVTTTPRTGSVGETPPRTRRTDGPPARAEPLVHREIVVRRLLDRGLSPAALRTLLPDFGPLVDRLARRL
jgi:hypothetical protein